MKIIGTLQYEYSNCFQELTLPFPFHLPYLSRPAASSRAYWTQLWSPSTSSFGPLPFSSPTKTCSNPEVSKTPFRLYMVNHIFDRKVLNPASVLGITAETEFFYDRCTNVFCRRLHSGNCFCKYAQAFFMTGVCTMRSRNFVCSCFSCGVSFSAMPRTGS